MDTKCRKFMPPQTKILATPLEPGWSVWPQFEFGWDFRRIQPSFIFLFLYHSDIMMLTHTQTHTHTSLKSSNSLGYATPVDNQDKLTVMSHTIQWLPSDHHRCSILVSAEQTICLRSVSGQMRCRGHIVQMNRWHVNRCIWNVYDGPEVTNHITISQNPPRCVI